MIDLDQARAARREAANVSPTLLFGGKTYTLPVELPLVAVISLKRFADATRAKNGEALTESLLEAMKSLLGDQYDEFMRSGPSVNDLVEIVQGIPAEYGLGLGESNGSGAPSRSTTARSKPRSAKSTA